jgi:hypothetical protein
MLSPCESTWKRPPCTAAVHYSRSTIALHQNTGKALQVFYENVTEFLPTSCCLMMILPIAIAPILSGLTTHKKRDKLFMACPDFSIARLPARNCVRHPVM